MSKQKIITAVEARKKQIKDLAKDLADTMKQIAFNKLEMKTGKQKNTNILMRLRKAAARIKTVIYEKQQLLEVNSTQIK